MIAKKFSFFQTHKFFPQYIYVDNNETISIDKRPEVNGQTILDINLNDSHIGMIIGIYKKADKIYVGPSVINKPYVFRNILNYTFIKLLEFYSLHGINTIIVKMPNDLEFKDFLEKLGFKIQSGDMIIDISGTRRDGFMEEISFSNFKIRNKTDQIEAIIVANNPNLSKNEFNKLLSKIMLKIKEDYHLDSTYWTNRQISQINVMLNAAKLYESKLNKEEFLEMMIKTVTSTFELGSREAKMEAFLDAVEDKTVFTSAAHIQKIVEKMKELLQDEIKHIDREEYRDWIAKNMEKWILVDENHKRLELEKEKASMLNLNDFGPINSNLEPIIKSIIDHYNGDCIFFGIKNKINN